MNSKITKISALGSVALCAVLAGCDSIVDVKDEAYAGLPPQTVVLKGGISGLSTQRPLTLQNNDESDARGFVATLGEPITRFSFGSYPVGTTYNVTVKEQPFGKICTVNNGTGTFSIQQPPEIEVVCVANEAEVPRYNVTVTTPVAFTGREGAKVLLTTEDGIRCASNDDDACETGLPAGGGTVTFPDAVFNAAGQGTTNANVWTVSAITTEGSAPGTPLSNRCVVTSATGQNPTANVTTPAVGSCVFTISGTVAYSRPFGVGADPAMGTGGVTLQRRTQNGVDLGAPVTVNAFGNFTLATDARSNSVEGVNDIVVTQHPAGQTCLVAMNTNPRTASISSTSATNARTFMTTANLYLTGTLNPADLTTVRVLCRNVPTAERQLRGTYRMTSVQTLAPTQTAADVWNPNAGSRNYHNIMTFFEDGSFLYGIHGSSSSSTNVHTEHGFYDYDPAAAGGARLRFSLITDTYDTSGGSTGSGGLSHVPGSLTVGTGSTQVRYRSMVGVTKTAGPPSVIRGVFGEDSTTATTSRTEWIFTEVDQIPSEMTGGWVSQDHRRAFAYDWQTTYGHHTGVNNGVANIQDACYTMDNPRVSRGFFTRRGSVTGCDPSLGGAGTVDLPSAFTAVTLPANWWPGAGQTRLDLLLPGYVARLPGAANAFDGRYVSPVYFRVAPANSFFPVPEADHPEYFTPDPHAPDPTTWCSGELLGIRATENGFAKDFPVYFCRTSVN